MQQNSWQSRFYTIRSNKVFELLVISIIIFSALVTGAKTYEIQEDVSCLRADIIGPYPHDFWVSEH